jgi:hypothetical protein
MYSSYRFYIDHYLVCGKFLCESRYLDSYKKITGTRTASHQADALNSIARSHPLPEDYFPETKGRNEKPLTGQSAQPWLRLRCASIWNFFSGSAPVAQIEGGEFHHWQTPGDLLC